MDFTGGNVGISSNTFTYGYSITTSMTLNVTGLGVLDFGNDGLTASHQVGLWNSAGALLASTTVAAGTGADQNIVSTSGAGSFRVNNITPFSLTAGTYTLGAVFGNNADAIATSATAAPASRVTFGGALVGFSGFSRPTTSAPAAVNAGYFGPTFVIGSAAPAVPEPGSIAILVGMSVTGAAFLNRKRRN